MAAQELSRAREMCRFIDACPSPYHAAAEVARRLEARGFERLDERAAWGAAAGKRYVLRGGGIVAWAAREGAPPEQGFRIVAAHTDSPNLRVKPRPDTGSAGCRQLGVEVYGGALLNSWLDRDLGLSGRALVRGERGARTRLFLVARPILRVPQLAIHLDREISTNGLSLDKQRHLSPLWALGPVEEGGFRAFLAAELGVATDEVLSFDAMVHDVQPAAIVGRDEELVSAPRLDNLCSSWTGMEALLATADEELDVTPVLCLFDHEEVGSGSHAGAGGPLLKDVLERVVLGRGGGREEVHRALAGSVCCSADMAHATHPNYAERHEPAHRIRMNGGPVIKVNTNQRYATDAEGEAVFRACCAEADVPVQEFVMRSDLACGSTIGPLTAANLGLRTVDVGVAQLAMHSARELCGARDPALALRAVTAFCRGAGALA